MIALPFNDYSCLGSITEVIAELVENQDPVITELAQQHSTREGLIAYIRGLPQRDDDGEKDDGPKVEACAPPQRLRIPAADPNCVEARRALPRGCRDHRSEAGAPARDARHTRGHAHVPTRERRPGDPRSARYAELSRLRRRGREARAFHDRSARRARMDDPARRTQRRRHPQWSEPRAASAQCGDSTRRGGHRAEARRDLLDRVDVFDRRARRAPLGNQGARDGSHDRARDRRGRG